MGRPIRNFAETKIESLDTKINGLRTNLETKIESVRTEVHGLRSELQELRQDLRQKWEHSLDVHERLATIEAKLEIR